MAKKKESLAGDVADIRDLIEQDKVIIGTDNTMKALRDGKLSKVMLSSNCREDIKEDIRHFAEIGKVVVVELSQANDELGIICKKPFSISVLGIKE